MSAEDSYSIPDIFIGDAGLKNIKEMMSVI